MSKTQPTQSAVSQVSNWPYVDKAAFWKEDKTLLKVIKFVTSVIILPLAFVMDLVNKGYNFIWAKKEVKPEVKVESKIATRWGKVKNFAKDKFNVIKTFCANHQKGLKIGGIVTAVLAAAGGVYALRNPISSAYCSTIGLGCNS